MSEFVDSLRIKSDTKHLSQVRGFVSSAVQRSDLPDTEENRIVLAVDEAVTNIIEHAYDNRRDCDIGVEIAGSDETFTVSVTDSGKHFDPTMIENPDIESHVKEGRRNGLGIFLIRQVMDEVHYDYVEGVENRLRLVRYVRQEDE